MSTWRARGCRPARSGPVRSASKATAPGPSGEQSGSAPAAASAALRSAVRLLLSALQVQALAHHMAIGNRLIYVAFETMRMRFEGSNSQNRCGLEQSLPTATPRAPRLSSCARGPRSRRGRGRQPQTREGFTGKSRSPPGNFLRGSPARGGRGRRASPRGRPRRKPTTTFEGHGVKLLNTRTSRSANTV